MKRKTMLAGLLSAATVLTLAGSAYAADSTVVVTGDTSAGENQPGWLFNRDASTSTPFEFTSDKASIGNGSVYILPIGSNPSDKFIAENFINTAIADINEVSYDFLIGNGGEVSDANQFYMNVYANFGESDPFKFYDCRYNVVPTVGSKDGFTTVTFDPTQAYPVTTRGGASASPYTCPAVPADMDTLSSGSTIRVFALNVGDTSASDQGLDGYYDNVVVNKTSGITTYDFEPKVGPASNLDQCKNNGWMQFNNPSFNSYIDCIVYVSNNNKTVSGSASYTAYGLKRNVSLSMSTAVNTGAFTYYDANWGYYSVTISEVRVNGNNAYFAGKVSSASNNAWKGQWLFAKVSDGSPDKIWGSFTNEAAARAGVINMSDPADGPFNVTSGNISIH